MQYSFKLEQFEGPLELLLKLIEDEKLDITTISLAKVTDQYLAYLENESELPPDEVADFLVVAAKLIYIKSKYLLPSLELDDEEGVDLEQQLKIYREYYQASKRVAALIGKKKFSYARLQPLKLPQERKFSPPPSLMTGDMAAVFADVLKRLDAIAKLPKIFLKTTISIKEKISALKDAIKRGIMNFSTFYSGSDKQDVIISFLALLELVKMKHVAVEQRDLFSDIVITKVHSYE